MDFELMKHNTGELKFHPTDNERKINGIINYNISKFDYLKFDYKIYNSEMSRGNRKTK